MLRLTAKSTALSELLVLFGFVVGESSTRCTCPRGVLAVPDEEALPAAFFLLAAALVADTFLAAACFALGMVVETISEFQDRHLIPCLSKKWLRMTPHQAKSDPKPTQEGPPK